MNTQSIASGLSLGVALLRVSTDKQFQEGESIEAQRRKTEFVARRERIDLVSFFVEHYSGRKTDRKVMDDLFEFLRDNPDVDSVVIGDIDRFTRGGSEIYLSLKRRLHELNVRLIDTVGIIQPERNRMEHLGVEYPWSIESPSRYAEVFMAEKARAEASDILTRLITQEVLLTREGYQCRQSNFGYRNEKITTDEGKRKTIMIPDELEAPWIVRMFELKADGGWSDDAICEHINAMGYRSRPKNKRDPNSRKIIGQSKPKELTPKQLNRYIERSIYCGVRCEVWNQGTPVRTPFEPLVSISLFNHANRGKVRIIENKDGNLQIIEGKAEYQNHKENPDFLLRHVVSCPECGKPLVASKSKGKSGRYFGYFHCARGHKRFSVSQKVFDTTVGNYLDMLEAKPGFLPLFREVVREVWIRKTRAARGDTEQIDAHIKSLKQKQDTLLEKLTSCSSQIVQEKLEHQIEEIETAIQSATTHRKSAALQEDDIAAFFEHAKKLMEHPRQSVFCAGTKPRLHKIWRFIFSQMPNYQNFVDGTPQLSLLYRLNQQFDGSKGPMVIQLSEEWNTFETDVRALQDGLSGLAPRELGSTAKSVRREAA